MARISSDQIGLRDAADIFGVSIDTLRRRIRDNQLDEAVLVQGPFGATWVLPRAGLSAIAEREGWDDAGSTDPTVSRVSAPTHAPAQPRPEPIVASSAGDGISPSVIDLTVDPTPVLVGSTSTAPVAEVPQGPAASQVAPPPPPAITGSVAPTPPSAAPAAPPAPASGPSTDDLVLEVTAAVAEELARGLSDNVHAELSAVREAITAAEVKAVAADARTDALRAEKGRLEAQLKRAEADIEYWRSQHDRLDKDLDRERALRVTSDKAKSVAESETRVVRERVAELSVEVSDTQTRERALIATEAALQAELDQATMVMGWWSRRRLTKLQARSSGRTPPPPVGD